MLRLNHCLRAALAFIVWSSNLLAATIKKPNDDIVEGAIHGLIVQKATVTTVTEGAEVRFTTTYTLIPGGDIAAITEAGVTRAS